MEILFLDLSTAGFSNKTFVIKNQGYWHLVQLINPNRVSFPQHSLTIKEPDQYIRTLNMSFRGIQKLTIKYFKQNIKLAKHDSLYRGKMFL